MDSEPNHAQTLPMNDLAAQILQDEARREETVQRLRARVADLESHLEVAHEKYASGLRAWRGERAELQAKIAARFEEASIAKAEVVAWRSAAEKLQGDMNARTLLVRGLARAVREGADVEVDTMRHRVGLAFKVSFR